VFWTHNDSGDRPRLYAFDRHGQALATLLVAGARAADWEDMAAFTVGRGKAAKHYLLAADVGDNGRRRTNCRLYVIPEPPVDPRKRNAELTARAVLEIPFRYPDGPRDCEAVAVDAAARKVYLVEKLYRRDRSDGAGVYVLPLPKAPPAGPVVARRIARVPIRNATAMDLSPDGRRLVVCTYREARIYTRRDKQTWQQALAATPQTVPLPRRRQGEAIAYGPDGWTLLLTSERLPTPFIAVPRKTTPTTGPTTRSGRN
jgi:hypothetical protein